MNGEPNGVFLLRAAILSQLEAAYPASLWPRSLYDGLVRAEFNPSESDFARETAYLRERGFIAETPSELCPNLKRLRITAAGLDYLMSGEK